LVHTTATEASEALQRRELQVPIDSIWMRRSVIGGPRVGFLRQQSQSGSLPPVPVEVGRFTRLVHQNGAGSSAVLMGAIPQQQPLP
jgi:hypothetical protein